MSEDLPSLLVTAGWLAAAAGFMITALALLMAVPRRHAMAGPLVAACLAMAVTAACSAAAHFHPELTHIAQTAQIASALAWIIVLHALRAPPPRAWLVMLAAIVLLTVATSGLRWLVGPASDALGPWLAMLAAAVTLALVVRRTQQAARDEFWRRKHLLIATSAMAGCALVLSGLRLLGQAPAADRLETARGILFAFLVPLVLVGGRRICGAARSDGWSSPAGSTSRRLLTFAADALLVCLVTLEVERLAGPAAASLAIILMAAVLLILAVPLLSGQLRADRQGSFGSPLDYRREWLRFIDTVARAAQGGTDDLPLRLVTAVAGVVDSTGGGIWQRSGADRYQLLALRGLPRPPVRSAEAPGLAALLRSSPDIIELDQLAAVQGGPPWPKWLPRPPAAWLLLPLVHRGTVTGLIVLAAPRVHRVTGAEERMLLRTLSHQAASYLAEDAASRALADAQRYAEFTRQFAFVAHDLKNLASALAVTAANARRYRGIAAFENDLLATLDGAVTRLDGLLARLRGEVEPVMAETDLGQLLAGIAAARPSRPPLVAAPAPVRARTDALRLVEAIGHLVDNGFEASGATGQVVLALRKDGPRAVIEVRDDGPGMSDEFLERRLFRPFASTKPDGLGLGLVEARHIVESLGGRLEASSAPGDGTIMRIVIPCLPTAA